MNPAVRRSALLSLCALAVGALTLTPRSQSLSMAAMGLPRGAVHRPPAVAATPEERLRATGSSPAYHSGARSACSDCHLLGLNPVSREVPPGPLALSRAPRPRSSTLKSDDLTQLCLDCHDGRAGIPDVLDADANGLADRSAGHFTFPGQVNGRGHDLSRAGRAAGEAACGGCHGGAEPPGVTCIDCHDPHGNGNPRNLRWASDPAATPPLGLFVRPGASGPARYERANVAYGTLGSDDLREVTSLCLDCHHLYSGKACTDPDQDGIHSRHPSFDSERGDPATLAQGAAKGSTDPARWARGDGTGFQRIGRLPFLNRGASSHAEAARIDPAANGVFCLTCHKAHGSDEAFGLNWRQTGAAARAGCDQCHSVDGFADAAVPGASEAPVRPPSP